MLSPAANNENRSPALTSKNNDSARLETTQDINLQLSISDLLNKKR